MSLPDVSKIAYNIIYKSCTKPSLVHEIYSTSLVDEIYSTLMSEYIVEYHASGTFTTAVLMSRPGNTVFVGTSKRNPVDKPNHLRGKCTALARAIHAFTEHILYDSHRTIAVQVLSIDHKLDDQTKIG